MEATNETVQLGVLEDTGVYATRSVRGDIRMYSRVGRRSPLHCTARAKCCSPTTETTLRAFWIHGSKVRARHHDISSPAGELQGPGKGYAFDDEEFEEAALPGGPPATTQSGWPLSHRGRPASNRRDDRS